MGNSESKRNANIELLRVLLMMFIIMHHCIVNGYGLQGQLTNVELVQANKVYSCFLGVLNSIVVIGVNVFFLISGYFQIRFTLEKFVKLVIDIYLYGSILTIIALIFEKTTINMLTLQYLILPFQKYWFVLVYLILMIISPLLNNAFDKLGEQVAKTLYFVIFVIACIYGFVFEATWLGLNNGYSVGFAVFLYFTGYVMKKYEILGKGERTRHLLKWIMYTFATAILVCVCIMIGKNDMAWSCFSYNQPFIVLSSIHVFWIFLKAPNINASNSKKYMRLAKHVLPVYYIHTSIIFAYYRNIPLQYVGRNYNFLLQIIFLLLYAVLIFGLCVVIDIVKGKMLDKGIVRFQKWICGNVLKIWNALWRDRV